MGNEISRGCALDGLRIFIGLTATALLPRFIFIRATLFSRRKMKPCINQLIKYGFVRHWPPADLYRPLWTIDWLSHCVDNDRLYDCSTSFAIVLCLPISCNNKSMRLELASRIAPFLSMKTYRLCFGWICDLFSVLLFRVKHKAHLRLSKAHLGLNRNLMTSKGSRHLLVTFGYGQFGLYSYARVSTYGVCRWRVR